MVWYLLQRILVTFFLENIEGIYKLKKVELSSDASKITGKVNIDGKRLTDSWKESLLFHIVVFRQERDMAFHLTLLGPSCCEIPLVLWLMFRLRL
ncbi:B3 domain-containing protein REM14 [Cardamine amara subsp. amara]|uniref:B3 domain-containing protein REM14 n=1 Tax=Cardamine amara subsp. amara TaxID=228776 RepID=A0ABD1ACP9_CARAN